MQRGLVFVQRQLKVLHARPWLQIASVLRCVHGLLQRVQRARIELKPTWQLQCGSVGACRLVCVACEPAHCWLARTTAMRKQRTPGAGTGQRQLYWVRGRRMHDTGLLLVQLPPRRAVDSARLHLLLLACLSVLAGLTGEHAAPAHELELRQLRRLPLLWPGPLLPLLVLLLAQLLRCCGRSTPRHTASLPLRRLALRHGGALYPRRVQMRVTSAEGRLACTGRHTQLRRLRS